MITTALGVLRLPRTVLFGPGQRHAIADAVAGLGRTALICTDARLAADPELATIRKEIEAAGVRVEVFGDTQPELPVDGVLDCVRGLAGHGVDVVVGIGGGSCLDMAKAVALLLSHGGKPQDYYGENAVPGPILPVVAVPTTAGTGSEATPVAVFADPDREMKVGISSPHLIPHTAVCDPELTHSCPPGLTAHSGADALTHLVESFTAVTRTPDPRLAFERVFIGKSALTDHVALNGLELIGRSLLKAYRDPADAGARHDVMLAAFAGGVALGTAGTAAAHALQYPLGAATHTPHGLGVGVLLPYVMRFNLPVRVREFAQIARALGVGDTSLDDTALARAAIEAVDALIDGLGLPRTIAELGLPESRLGWLAEQGMGAARLVQNNPRPLDLPAMNTIARAAFTGDRGLPA
ncbi:iron-containing alcohol dehydrogenase [Actinoplanes sp. GCM10030250]|uniref:iron-containing alcohol dehydrogenase n=1 Tax=Actinoplanes sp. GCM10030250 TaxID=3273376 RepID=UPI00361BA107